jgi:hypothetical protein
MKKKKRNKELIETLKIELDLNQDKEHKVLKLKKLLEKK